MLTNVRYVQLLMEGIGRCHKWCNKYLCLQMFWFIIDKCGLLFKPEWWFVGFLYDIFLIQNQQHFPFICKYFIIWIYHNRGGGLLVCWEYEVQYRIPPCKIYSHFFIFVAKYNTHFAFSTYCYFLCWSFSFWTILNSFRSCAASIWLWIE